MVVYVIDYYSEEGLGDCYPDFCYSREEAERIAPEFQKQLPWAVRFEIREESL